MTETSATSRTFGEIVTAVAAEFGHEPTTTEIAHILWEHTGFPGFWDGDPAECCEAQVRSFYESDIGRSHG